jgi:uncharacterized membrane protein
MSKKIKILIICSLLFNLLFIGIIIGHVSHHLSKRYLFIRDVEGIAERLPDNKKELFFKTIKGAHRESKNNHKQIRDIRKRIIYILTAPEFDEAAYQSSIEKLHKTRGLMMRRLADANKELAKQLNQEERKILAEYLSRPQFLKGRRRSRRRNPALHY